MQAGSRTICKNFQSGVQKTSKTSEIIRTTQNVQSINPGHNIKIAKLRHYRYIEN
jgi:hypothetical protein